MKAWVSWLVIITKLARKFNDVHLAQNEEILVSKVYVVGISLGQHLAGPKVMVEAKVEGVWKTRPLRCPLYWG